MYEISEGISVELNRTTPASVKAYQKALEDKGVESVGNVANFVKEELIKKTQDGEITEESIRELVSKALRHNGIASFDIFYDKSFVFKWLKVIFKVTDKQASEIETNFEDKFSVDEFSRGYTDFFARLRNPLIG